ncbi:hypothetical protein [Pseudodesulfovibrio sediminis]|uniref:Uncharacterized protein n=1 Tax=Pseudodesulfovibrio sediminis TaxID=2810563 RepID=A0ABM7P686_9BACT|nr:hypothetical protein [Pseudodesulfovibrio sediminis]BCS88319.1 hypothetical protein PSDVSF_15610 [Pseudodesulfovibrio sediminis]
MNYLTTVDAADRYYQIIPQHYRITHGVKFFSPHILTHFHVLTHRNSITDLDTLMHDLEALQDKPTLAVVRGTLRGTQEEADSVGLSTLQDTPQNWICVPIDGLDIPRALSELPSYEIARNLVDNHFPEEFHHARFILQHRGLAGYDFDWSEFHANLFFWNETPITSREVLRYFDKNTPMYGIDPLHKPIVKLEEIGHHIRIITANPEYEDINNPDLAEPLYPELDPVLARGEKRVQMIEGTKAHINLDIPEIEYDNEFFRSRVFKKALYAKSKGTLNHYDLKEMGYALRNLGLGVESVRFTLNKCGHPKSAFTNKDLRAIYGDPDPRPELGKDTLLKFAGII